MRASRLLSILMLLQARGRMSAEALAAEVEVSVRTIHRDIDELSASGVPIYAERGRTGGFQLLEGWRTRLTGLTAEEARALFLSGLPGPAAALGLGEAMAAAQLKLLAALPAGWQADATRVSARFHLDAAGWYRGVSDTEHLQAVAAGVWAERRLEIRYQSWRGVVERQVEPLGLVLKAGTWYLVAGVGGALRTYRVSNIRDLSPTEERFERPAGFDLARSWREAAQTFEAGLLRGDAALRVSPQGLRLLQGSGAAVAEAVARTAEPAEADGWSRVTIPVEATEHAVRDLLRLGPEAVVLSPPSLREAVAEGARRIAALYAATLPAVADGSDRNAASAQDVVSLPREGPAPTMVRQPAGTSG